MLKWNFPFRVNVRFKVLSGFILVYLYFSGISLVCIVCFMSFQLKLKKKSSGQYFSKNSNGVIFALSHYLDTNQRAAISDCAGKSNACQTSG